VETVSGLQFIMMVSKPAVLHRRGRVRGEEGFQELKHKGNIRGT
jgi:hypothetical protein